MCVNYQMHHSDVCPPYFKLYDSWSTHTPTCMDRNVSAQIIIFVPVVHVGMNHRK